MGEKEKHIEHYPNGKKKKEGTFKDGKEDGLATRWHENGQKSSEKTYKDGRTIDKTSWFYYENGLKKEEQTHKGWRMIFNKCWDEEGNEMECN